MASTTDRLKKWLILRKSYQWLEKVGLRKNPEAKIPRVERRREKRCGK